MKKSYDDNNMKIEGIDRVFFKKSRKAKRIILFLEDIRTLRISVPHWTSFRNAKKLVYSNLNWVNVYLEKMRTIQKQHDMCRKKQPILDKEKTKKILLQRIEMLSKLYGYRYNNVTIRNQKTRWGSCSQGNNISLNMKIARLPDVLMDYVLVHELVHTKIKNHKEFFWDEVKRILPKAMEYDSMLKKYRINLL